MEDTLQTAKDLLAQGEYGKVIDVISESADSGHQSAEALKLATIAFLNLLVSPTDEEATKAFYDILSSACAQVTSIEELVQLNYEVECQFYSWEKRLLQNILNELKENPCYELWNEYSPWKLGFLEIAAFIDATVLDSPIANKYFEDPNHRGSASKSLWKYAENKITSEEISKMEMEAADFISEAAQYEITANGEGTPDFVCGVLQKSWLYVCIANNLYDSAIRTEKVGTEFLPIKDEINFDCYERLSDLWTFALNAITYPDGKAFSLIIDNDDRYTNLNRLKGFYEQMKRIHPDFEAPDLPSAVGFNPNTDKSGGCYVATAIYGSYDCPQVWTLRRFRDDTLAKTWYGRAFIHTYYAISPTLVKWFGKKAWFKNMWKPTLDRMVWQLNSDGVADSPYKDKSW